MCVHVCVGMCVWACLSALHKIFELCCGSYLHKKKLSPTILGTYRLPLTGFILFFCFFHCV